LLHEESADKHLANQTPRSKAGKKTKNGISDLNNPKINYFLKKISDKKHVGEKNTIEHKIA